VVAAGDDVLVGAAAVSVGAVVPVAFGWVLRQAPSSNDTIIKLDKTKRMIRVLWSIDLLSYCKRFIWSACHTVGDLTKAMRASAIRIGFVLIVRHYELVYIGQKT